ncbi:thioredoxin TrxC [Vibrio sp.]|nr:thioredoxin TrxC [Vibrio sp.]
MSTFTTRCPNCQAMNRIPNERISEQPNCGKCQSPLLDGMPIEGTVNNISALLESQQPIVIDFWAPWCNPCIGFAPVFSDVAEERKGAVRFVKINTEDQQMLATQYQIRSIPSIMVFKGGKKVDMINGALPKSQFSQWLEQALLK